jgi:hypothetical protein
MRIEAKRIKCVKGHTRKKHVAIVCRSQCSLYGGYWDGGSRTEWFQLDLQTGQRERLTYPTSPPQFGGGDAPTVSVPRGKAIVSGGVFCGKDATLRLHVNAHDIPELLGVPAMSDEAPVEAVIDWLIQHGFDVR